MSIRRESAHRYEALDGLRGIAALSVMLGHFGQILGVYWPAHMFLAVDAFFIMSGFVIAHSYSERLRRGMPALSYLYRRLTRLYPMFIAGLTLGAAVLYYGARSGAIAYATGDILHSVALNAAYIPFLNTARIGSDLGQIFPADPPAWSLFLEMLASGAFLLLFDLKRNALIGICTAFYLALISVDIYLAQGSAAWITVSNGFDTSNFLGGVPRVGFGFVCGVILQGLMREGYGAHRMSELGRRVPYPSFALYAVLLAVFVFPKSLHGIYPAVAIATLAPAIVFIGAHIRTRNGLETNVARALGWISYPVYCLHVPVVRLAIYARGGPQSPPYAMMFVSAAITLGLAAALAKWYEEPLRSALTGAGRPPPVHPAPAPD